MAEVDSRRLEQDIGAQIEGRIRQVLAAHAQLAVRVTDLSRDADLYDAGMTSRASVNVMIGLETEFDTEFPDAMLRRDVFSSIAAMGRAIEELLAVT